MAVPTGRSDKRIPKEVMVELVLPDASQLKEAAIAQNVSARGMRVTTGHVWRPGDSVLLSHTQSGFRTRARVVYCERSEEHTSELQSRLHLVCRLLLEKKNITTIRVNN